MKERVVVIVMLTIFTVGLWGCGKSSDTALQESKGESAAKEESVIEEEGDNEGISFAVESSDELFYWDENDLIIGLTEEGMSQEEIVIPARCKGFSGNAFGGSEVKRVTFADNADISLDMAFSNAENLREVVLPEELSCIPYMSFSMSAIESLVIPEKVTSIEGYAFSSCESLTSISFMGNSLRAIGENAFEFCDLKTLDLPDGLEEIQEYAFFENAGLEELQLPSSVRKIGGNAFGSTALTELHLPAEMKLEEYDVIAFGNVGATMTVYIKEGSWLDQNRDVWAGLFGSVVYEK